MKPRTLGITVVVLALAVIGFLFFRLPQPIIELAPEKLVGLGGFRVTNTILTAWVMIAVLSLITIAGTRKLSLVPSGFQNFFEAIVEGFGNIVTNVAGERNGRRFLPVVFTIFLYIVFCNWSALTPLFNQIGLVENKGAEILEAAHAHPNDVVHEPEKLHGWVMQKAGISIVPLFQSTKLVEVDIPEGITLQEKADRMNKAIEAKLGRPLDEDSEVYGLIAPFLRGVNTDLNATLSYAIWSAIFVELWGITTLGLLSYGSKFFNFKRLFKGDIVNGIIDVFVGLLELVSEFARLISFTFRLFGNIFAGEVLLFMMSFLVPFLLVDVFYALEIFVGLIQGFVFAMLTLVFGVMAVSAHGDHDEHHAEEHVAPAAAAGGSRH
ncbi:MAG: F0F1 ATP synthase subunit A [Dehalococcoidia bacterium]